MFISSLIASTFSLFLLNSSTGDLVSKQVTYSSGTYASNYAPQYSFSLADSSNNRVDKTYYLMAYDDWADDMDNREMESLLTIKYHFHENGINSSLKVTITCNTQSNVNLNFYGSTSAGTGFASFDTLLNADSSSLVTIPYSTQSAVVFGFRATLYHAEIYSTMTSSDTAQAYENGYENGKNAGYQDGYLDGMTDAGSSSYTDGFNAGKQVGFQEGAQSGTTFWSLFGAVADTPVMMIRRLFNFDLFGTSMVVVALSLLSFLILFKVIKKVIK